MGNNTSSTSRRASKKEKEKKNSSSGPAEATISEDNDDASTAALSKTPSYKSSSRRSSFGISSFGSTNNDCIDLSCFDIELSSNATTNAAGAGAPPEEQQQIVDNEEYVQSLRPLRLAYETDDGLFRSHFACKKVSEKHDDDENVIIQQHILELLDESSSSSSSSLPVDKEGGSIFVRVLDSNVKIVRALFTGPENTPYANGCYFFDIYLKDYPFKAPLVKFCSPPYNPAVPEKYTINHMINKRTGHIQTTGWDKDKSTLKLLLMGIQKSVFYNALLQQQQNKQLRKNATAAVPKIQFNKTKRLTLAYGISVYLDGLMSTYRRTSSSSTISNTSFLFPEFETVLMKHFVHKSDSIHGQCADLLRVDNNLPTSKSLVKKVQSYLTHLEDMDRIHRACAMSKKEYYYEKQLEELQPEEWNSSGNYTTACYDAPPPIPPPSDDDEEEKVEIDDELVPVVSSSSSFQHHSNLPSTLVAEIDELVPSSSS